MENIYYLIHYCWVQDCSPKLCPILLDDPTERDLYFFLNVIKKKKAGCYFSSVYKYLGHLNFYEAIQKSYIFVSMYIIIFFVYDSQ